MADLTVDFNKVLGAVKPIHATNNGPCAKLEDIAANTEGRFSRVI